MSKTQTLQEFLDGATVEAEVFALRPDYRALLIAVDGIETGESDAASEALLAAAETSARTALQQQPVEDIAHVAAWREAYRAFGSKPQRTRNSLEALLRRAESGLPRVNRLTDIYNGISVLHQVPLGGENLQRYIGSPRLIRATGSEEFDTTAGGQDSVETPDVGEVVWGDAQGVTCRRWNWRQGKRTQLTDSTTSAFFILDALEPLDDAALTTAAAALVSHLKQLGPDVVVAQRLISAP